MRLISASSSTTRNIRGLGLPGCSWRVMPPSSLKPKPSASMPGRCASLVHASREADGLGNVSPNSSIGRLSPPRNVRARLSAQPPRPS